MAEGTPDQSDERSRTIFISYNKVDVEWAVWIAFTIEQNGFVARIQEWDFEGNFVLEMHRALIDSSRMIAVLSRHYMQSRFTQSEWSAVFARDPSAREDLIVPVRVEDFEVEGLLRPIIYVDFVNIDQATARARLISRLRRGRRKPDDEPPFPGVLPTSGSPTSPPSFPSAVHNLPRRSGRFVGRDDTLQQLNAHFHSPSHSDSPRVIAINGLGGIGKSSLALQYAYSHRSRFRVIWWIRASSLDTIRTDIVSLKRALDRGSAPESSSFDQELVAALDVLEQSDSWLLIYDDLFTSTLANVPMPRFGNGSVLITSRLLHLSTDEVTINLSLPSRDEGIKILDPDLRELPTDPDIARIVDLVDRLPLALCHARRYMAQQKVTPNTYIARFTQSHKDILDWKPIASEYSSSLAATWTVSMDAAKIASPLAEPLLALLSCLSSERLPRNSLHLLVSSRPDLQWTDLLLEEALRSLEQFSLIAIDESSVSVHKLVQLVARDSFDEQLLSNSLGLAFQCIYHSLARDPHNPSAWADFSEYIPHIISLNELALQTKSEPLLSGILSMQLGLYLVGRYDFESAIVYMERSIALIDETPNISSSEIVSRFTNVSGVYSQLGRLDEARVYSMRAVQISDASGLRHASSAPVYYNYGVVLRDCGLADEAIEVLHVAAMVGLNYDGRRRSATAVRYAGLASVYLMKANFRLAEVYLRKADRVFRNSCPPASPLELLDAMEYTIHLLTVQNRFDDCVARARLLCEHLESTLPADHPAQARAKELSARSYLFSGEFDLAFTLSIECLSIARSENASYANAIGTAADALFCSGRLGEAVEHYRQEEAALLRTDPDSPRLSFIASHRAGAFAGLGQIDLSDQDRLLAQARLARLPQGLPFSCLIQSCVISKQLNNAERWIQLQPVLELLEACHVRALGSDHIESLLASHNLGVNLLRIGKNAIAIEKLSATIDVVIRRFYPSTKASLIVREFISFCRGAGTPGRCDAAEKWLSGEIQAHPSE